MKKTVVLFACLLVLPVLGMAQELKKVEYSQLPKAVREFGFYNRFVRYGFMRNGYWEYGVCMPLWVGDKEYGRISTYRVYRGNQVDLIRKKVMENHQNVKYHNEELCGSSGWCIEQQRFVTDEAVYAWAFYAGYTIWKSIPNGDDVSLTPVDFYAVAALMNDQGSAFIVIGWPEDAPNWDGCLPFKREVESYIAKPETW